MNHPDANSPTAAGAPDTPRPPRVRWKTIALCTLGVLLVVYDALVLMAMIVLTPKNDFGRTFLSAAAFVRGEDMYAWNESIPWRLEDGTILDLWNLNPPHFHLLLLPLAWLPTGMALAVWLLANGVCGYFAFRLVLREARLELSPSERQLVLLGLLGFVGTSSALVTGHMSLLLCALVTLGWHAARHGRWTVAGVWLGLGLSIKPFLLFLVPYFLWRRQWRGLAALALTVLLCVAAGLAVFGVANHLAWRDTLARADGWAWLPLNASVMAFLSRTFTDNPLYTPLVAVPPHLVHTTWLAVGIPMGLLTYAAAFRDGSPRGVDRAFALMLVGSLLLSPLGWTYYFWLPLGPIAVLLAGWRRGEGSCPPWTRRLLKLSLVGLLYPLCGIANVEHSLTVTLLLSSLYFWGLLLVWLALLTDGLRPTLPLLPRTTT